MLWLLIKRLVKYKNMVGVLFAATVFVEVLFVVSIISAYIITEYPIIFPKYFPFFNYI